jgi:hypothetical protein
MSDVIVLIPGILGSVLVKDGREVWGVSGSSIASNLMTFRGALRSLELPRGVGHDDPKDGVTAPRVLPRLYMVPTFWKADGSTLEMGSPVPCRILGDQGLTNVDATLEEFAMDRGSAPQRVSQAHGADQLANFERHLRSAATMLRLPSPEQAKTGTMPMDTVTSRLGALLLRRGDHPAALADLRLYELAGCAGDGDHRVQAEVSCLRPLT